MPRLAEVRGRSRPAPRLDHHVRFFRETSVFDHISDKEALLPPLARFSVALIIFLLVPAFCRRIRLPPVVGLLAAGVLIGPSVLNLAPKNGEVAGFLAD